jgi:hypothetical protein
MGHEETHALQHNWPNVFVSERKKKESGRGAKSRALPAVRRTDRATGPSPLDLDQCVRGWAREAVRYNGAHH